MNNKKSKGYREKLLDILQGNDSGKNQKLRDLATAVGAHQPNANAIEFKDKIVNNINFALQTMAMVEMCKIANRNFAIALTATFIALGSSVAAWIAACK